MKFHKTHPIADVILIEPKVFADAAVFSWRRGRRKIRSRGYRLWLVQDNHSRSTQWTLRGMHMQVEHTQGKLVAWPPGRCRCRGGLAPGVAFVRALVGRGAVRPKSLNALGSPGLAHGVLVTSESADFLYKCTDIYSQPRADLGVG